jgi:hypothetical protein
MTEVIHGIVHGKTIELEKAPAVAADGQQVEVVLRPLPAPTRSEDGLSRSAGAWAEDAEELDRFLEETRRSRKHDRSEPPG